MISADDAPVDDPRSRGKPQSSSCSPMVASGVSRGAAVGLKSRLRLDSTQPAQDFIGPGRITSSEREVGVESSDAYCRRFSLQAAQWFMSRMSTKRAMRFNPPKTDDGPAAHVRVCWR